MLTSCPSVAGFYRMKQTFRCTLSTNSWFEILYIHFQHSAFVMPVWNYVGIDTTLYPWVSQWVEGGEGSLFPCSLPRLPYVPMFPHVLPYLFPFIIHLLTTYHRHRFPPAKKAPKTKLIKEENRLYVTFNLCETSFQAFERNSQSVRVGWALELTLLIKIGDRHHTTAALSRIGSYMDFRASL